MNIKIFQTVFYCIISLAALNCKAMDFNDGMKKIRSYQDFCQIYQEADVSYGDAVVAYQVDRRSTFYSKGSPLLDVEDQKLITSKESWFSRVHYALIELHSVTGLPPYGVSYRWHAFTPILSKDKVAQQLDIVASEQIANYRQSCFIFAEEKHFDETEFYYGAPLDAVRQQINILQTRDNLRMRAITALDAQILLKFLETQKVSAGWQDQWLTIALKRKFEQEYGFSYDSRETMKQKSN